MIMYSQDCQYINDLFKANSMAMEWNGNNCCDMQWGQNSKVKKRMVVKDNINFEEIEYNDDNEEYKKTIEYNNKDYKNNENNGDDKENENYEDNEGNKGNEENENNNNNNKVKRQEVENKIECKVIKNETKIISIKLQGNKNFQIKSEEFPKEFIQLSELKSLWLSKHKIKNLSSNIGNMKNLEELILINNGITGEIPNEIGELTHLVGLNLAGNKLKGPIPDSFSNLTNLTTLQLYNNHLEGPLPDLLLSLPIKTCTLNENHNLCLSDKAKFWDSECKNSITELCSDKSHNGKIGFVVFLIILLFISILVIFCFIYYRRHGYSIDNIKWEISNKKNFFKSHHSYSNSYSDYHRYYSNPNSNNNNNTKNNKKNNKQFSYYPSTKYNRSPKKKNYAEDKPVPSYSSKYLPSTDPYGYNKSLERKKSNNSNNNNNNMNMNIKNNHSHSRLHSQHSRKNSHVNNNNNNNKQQ
ncbi:hypothetical protein BCR32DRAFT_154431 [Anaeromyces robustus]|uniref:Disease resistance R13L4/SHOC-2-like LRR domain-containing protein n=1 Tax=Anaeromyces robustus TaxID=1754192 RepID=A0A1Y1XP33_9FUNG|nr:hypothetical protein BCR32DRAFT_154431 [Anaeromyces robustus]|eukprot:ORX87491.1 hypothetical protein BCR32DRAFT_154431 [Anaeromyces robustus]